MTKIQLDTIIGDKDIQIGVQMMIILTIKLHIHTQILHQIHGKQ